MRKLVFFTTTIILFLVFLAPAVLATGIKLISGNDQPSYSQTLGVYGDTDITQKFVSQVDNLSAVGTSIKNPNLLNRKDIIFTLYDENMKLVRTVTINGLNIEDGSFFKFVFDPIANSKNKIYFFNLKSPAAGPGNLIEVFLSQNPPTWIVEYNYDQKTYSGGIPIVIFSKPTSKLETVKEVYSNLFSRLLHPYSYKSQ